MNLALFSEHEYRMYTRMVLCKGIFNYIVKCLTVLMLYMAQNKVTRTKNNVKFRFRHGKSEFGQILSQCTPNKIYT